MDLHFRLNKLVRDRIPEIMHSNRVAVEVCTLTHKEHVQALKTKLLEEAQEVVEAQSRQELIEELADVKEVIEALALKLSIKTQEIDEAKRVKTFKKGGFDRGLFIKSVAASKASEISQRLLKNPNKYPQIEVL